MTILLPLLMTQLEDLAAFLDGFNNLESLINRPGHAFLTVDMFSCFNRIYGHLGMPVVGSGDDNSVNLIALEHLLIVTVAFCFF